MPGIVAVDADEAFVLVTILDTLPGNRTLGDKDWGRLSRSRRPRLDVHIAELQRLRDRLEGCIGCGWLSMSHCKS